jgi:hypothetical protein
MTKLPKRVKTIAASTSPLLLKTITGEDLSQRMNRKEPSAAELQPNKSNITTESTKFMSKNIRILRGLRDLLRGENIFRRLLHPWRNNS